MEETDNPLAKFSAQLEILNSLMSRSAEVASPSKPYYLEKHALWAKELIEKLHTYKMPVKVTPPEGVALNTIKFHYYQGAGYLRDKLDPTGKYKDLCGKTKCSQEGDYLLFTVRKSRFTPGVMVITETPKWKDEVIGFLETSVHGDKYALVNVLLSEEELLWIAAQIAPMSDLFENLSNSNRILIIRVDKDKLCNQVQSST